MVRVMRFLRIFKMIRHFVGLQSLFYTLHQVAWLLSAVTEAAPGLEGARLDRLDRSHHDPGLLQPRLQLRAGRCRARELVRSSRTELVLSLHVQGLPGLHVVGPHDTHLCGLPPAAHGDLSLVKLDMGPCH